MKIIYSPEQISPSIGRLCACIGFFDGVHVGHRYLIQQLITEAHERGESSAVVTFRNHPARVISPDYHPQLISTFDEKLKLLESTGVDYCIALDFNEEMRRLTARQFLEDFLCEKLYIRTLLIGYDHRFGTPQGETFRDYRKYGRICGIDVIKEKSFCPRKRHVSSTVIRNLLAEGKIDEAQRFLSHPYSINGIVEHGFKLGRKIGFPTANIRPCDNDKLIPGNGVYAVRVDINGTFYGGMLNIGTRPTVSSESRTSLEVHIFDFSGDIYGQMVNVSLEAYMREECHMNSLDELQAQLAIDSLMARKIIAEKYPD